VIALVTCNGILKYPDLFDVIVLEEAGTVATGVAYPCMRGARAAVLTGDPRQLLPFHARNDVQASSHLERFIDAGTWRTAFLNTTYRFGPATVKVLNQLVYKTPGKQLVAAREERRGVSELRWFDCQGSESDELTNEEEAITVVKMFQALTKESKSAPKSIAMISAYAKQVARIQTLLLQEKN